MVVLFFIFLTGTSILFSIVTVSIYSDTLFEDFLMITILTGVR